MEKIQVSIIMPLFNASKYLCETLESVKQQTFRDYELICINDCSNDNTMQIITEYANQDSRVKILSNTSRKGAAYSRNRGIDVAQGEYLCFLDGDDIFDETMLEMSLKKSVEYNLDMIIYTCIHMHSEEIHQKKFIRKTQKYAEKYCRKVFNITELEPYDILSLSDRVCDKLIKRELINKEKIRFQDIPSNNDALFATLALYVSQRVLLLDTDKVMVYARDHDDKNRISFYRNPMCVFWTLDKLQDEILRRKKEHIYYKYFFFYCLQQLSVAINQISTQSEKNNFLCFVRDNGLPQLINKNLFEYEKLDFCIKEEMKKIIFQKENIDFEKFLFYYRAQNVITLMRKEKMENRRIAIWGAGKNGIKIAETLKERSIIIKFFFDTDLRKQGEKIDYLDIVEPYKFLNQIDIIIASNEQIYYDILSLCMEKQIFLINFFE